MESLYGQARDQGLPLHVGVVVPPLTRTNLAGDDLSIWGHVVDGLANRGIPAALIEPEELAQVIVEGLERRAFWIEADYDQDVRYFGGRNRDTITRVTTRSSPRRPPPWSTTRLPTDTSGERSGRACDSARGRPTPDPRG